MADNNNSKIIFIGLIFIALLSASTILFKSMPSVILDDYDEFKIEEGETTSTLKVLWKLTTFQLNDTIPIWIVILIDLLIIFPIGLTIVKLILNR